MATVDAGSGAAKGKYFPVVLLDAAAIRWNVSGLAVALDAAVLAGQSGDQAPVWLRSDGVLLGEGDHQSALGVTMKYAPIGLVLASSSNKSMVFS